jgi:hypothetical protein
MATGHDDRNDDNDREDRITALKQQAGQIADGKMLAWESDALSPDDRERFWQDVIDFETAPVTTNFQQLIEGGVELPEPDSLDDERLTAKMWEVIHKLADLGVFIEFTNHMSDRELYTELWERVLRQESLVLGDGWCEHVNLLDGGEEGTRLYLKYYANERDRRSWLVQFPDYDMPAHEDAPYDRDKDLP